MCWERQIETKIYKVTALSLQARDYATTFYFIFIKK